MQRRASKKIFWSGDAGPKPMTHRSSENPHMQELIQIHTQIQQHRKSIHDKISHTLARNHTKYQVRNASSTKYSSRHTQKTLRHTQKTMRHTKNGNMGVLERIWTQFVKCLFVSSIFCMHQAEFCIIGVLYQLFCVIPHEFIADFVMYRLYLFLYLFFVFYLIPG